LVKFNDYYCCAEVSTTSISTASVGIPMKLNLPLSIIDTIVAYGAYAL